MSKELNQPSLSAVDAAAIPDDQQPHRDMSGQVPQEAGRIYTKGGPVLDPGVQTTMGGDATDRVLNSGRG